MNYISASNKFKKGVRLVTTRGGVGGWGVHGEEVG